jgi:hypothetical protein
MIVRLVKFEMDLTHMKAVVEIEGSDLPILTHVDLSSIESLRNTLSKAVWTSKPLEGPVMFWERGKR